MLRKRSQPHSLHLGRISILGDSLPERMRSTSVALLGFATITGLLLVSMALRQEFPFVASSPLPTPPSLHEDAPDRSPSRQAAVGPRGDAVSTAAPVLSHEAEDATPTASAPPAEGPVLGAGSPASAEKADPKRPPHRAPPPSSPVATETPTVAPAGQSSEGSSEPVPGPVSEPVPPHPGNGNAYGKGNGNGGVPPGHESGGPGRGHD